MVAFTKIAIAAASTLSAVNSLSLFNEYVDRALAIFNTPDELYSQYDTQQQNFFHIQKEAHVNDDTKPVPGKSPIEVCDYSTKQLLTLDEITISPNPPEAGANLTFTAKGTIDKTITDGAYVEVDVRYGFIKLIHQTYDICKEITKVDLECPIEKGKQVITKEVEIPEEVPPGKYLVTARAFTKDDEYITCLTATIEFPYQ
ncbi:Npc2 protein [Candida orthopsilosis Co 90-125]|uniref:Phosphatidylglycerol/phosphatidylinositol transfer protein n=1 Tax=Candida orthopsilosis (strain 90-125) TaxID=1136231 RepID=H8WW76_CANO9|nr:Npc2 protein [Candida orthopsilosis Co 90-125]CCG20700.1 Npc2 protein [Candida orthopsilosis Co 90-125]